MVRLRIRKLRDYALSNTYVDNDAILSFLSMPAASGRYDVGQ